MRMKAIAKLKSEEGLWATEVDVPKPKVGEVLVKIKKTAICGTDLHIYKWDKWSQETIPVPMVIGHEFCGVVVENGESCHRFEVGDRVSGEGHVVCSKCRNCRAGRGHLCCNTKGIGVNIQGAFAEYLVIPESNLIRLPDDISDEVASILDPFGNAVHTALSFDVVGEDVLVTGAGAIGIMGAMVVKHVGARKVVITDINPNKLELAKKMGIEYRINPMEKNLHEVMDELNMREGFDVGLEMSGSAQAFGDMIDIMNNGGKIAILGISPTAFEVDWNKIIFKLLNIKGISGREMYETWYKMIAMIQGGLDVSGIITHRFPAQDFQKGFDVMLKGNSGKVILNWE